MSYQAIARKWRPQTFEEITGQEAITRTLRNAVEHDRLHHAYLFSGARGVGKTTTARLLAKALNCHKTDKPNPQPCRVDAPDACVSCQEIAESRSIDVLEFDAASHTGVDDIREIILESININPARDRYKVFIIDEVHMLSNSSFNALLKTLEEPPPRVAFVMATTELHKLPDTILSRCQEFEFRTIPLQKIFERLKVIADAEKINASDEALREIARSGTGSMRDAQSNFDQVISFSGEKIETADVVVALGIASAEILTRTIRAIAQNKPAEALKVIDDLIGRGQDLRNFSRDLLAFFRDLLVFKMTGETENLLDTTVLSRAELEENSAPFTESDLIRFFNSLSETESKLREATEPRYVLEIGLVKLIEMRRVAPIEKILERLAVLENALADGNFGNVNLPTGNINQEKPAESFVAKPEKKTLTIDFPSEEVPFPVSPSVVSNVSNEIFVETKINVEELISFTSEEEIEIPSANSSAAPTNVNSPNVISFKENAAKIIEAIPIKLPPITAEELEHIEDTWLDADFERKLLQTGDNLSLFETVSKIVESLLGADQVVIINTKAEAGNNGSATAFAPAKEVVSIIAPDFETEDISEEIPVLPENPTEEEMWQYARNHPTVKKALRIFRGEIVEVRKI